MWLTLSSDLYFLILDAVHLLKKMYLSLLKFFKIAILIVKYLVIYTSQRDLEASELIVELLLGVLVSVYLRSCI